MAQPTILYFCANIEGPQTAAEGICNGNNIGFPYHLMIEGQQAHRVTKGDPGNTLGHLEINPAFGGCIGEGGHDLTGAN